MGSIIRIPYRVPPDNPLLFGCTYEEIRRYIKLHSPYIGAVIRRPMGLLFPPGREYCRGGFETEEIKRYRTTRDASVCGMRRTGERVADIAAMFNLSTGWVRVILRRNGLSYVDPGEKLEWWEQAKYNGRL